VQLSADIDFMYNSLEEFQLSLSRYRLAVIKQKRVSGFYVLLPLQVFFVKHVDRTHFYYDMIADYPDNILWNDYDPEILYVVLPDIEDTLVLMGLGRLLYRLAYSTKDLVHTFKNVDEYDYYNSLKQMRKVDRMYRLDLTPSLKRIPKSLILDKMLPLVGKGKIYKLLSYLFFFSLSLMMMVMIGQI